MLGQNQALCAMMQLSTHHSEKCVEDFLTEHNTEVDNFEIIDSGLKDGSQTIQVDLA